MLDQARLRQQFQTLLEEERQANKTYMDLMSKVDNPQVRRQIEQLVQDKNRHIELAERLLEIVG